MEMWGSACVCVCVCDCFKLTVCQRLLFGQIYLSDKAGRNSYQKFIVAADTYLIYDLAY